MRALDDIIAVIDKVRQSLSNRSLEEAENAWTMVQALEAAFGSDLRHPQDEVDLLERAKAGLSDIIAAYRGGHRVELDEATLPLLQLRKLVQRRAAKDYSEPLG